MELVGRISSTVWALISIAHPDFREGLERSARQHKLIPRAFW